jgi:hypothetical protein
MVDNAETRLAASGIELPPAPVPFGAYVPVVQTGSLLFPTGMLPTVGHKAKFIGRAGKELNAGRPQRCIRRRSQHARRDEAASWVSGQNLASRTAGVYIATAGEFADHVTVAGFLSLSCFASGFRVGAMTCVIARCARACANAFRPTNPVVPRIRTFIANTPPLSCELS